MEEAAGRFAGDGSGGGNWGIRVREGGRKAKSKVGRWSEMAAGRFAGEEDGGGVGDGGDGPWRRKDGGGAAIWRRRRQRRPEAAAAGKLHKGE